MKTALIIIAVIHGLIHLAGFSKAFGLMEAKELGLYYSKPSGILWLAAAVLFLCFAGLQFSADRYACFAGIVAVVLSQVLIVYFWKDTRFGSIANLIIFVVCFIDLGSFFIQNEFSKRVIHDFSQNNTLNTAILTQNDISHLPLAVQQYLQYTKSVGQPKVKNFRAAFTGRMRGRAEDDYMQMESVQYNFYDRPSRYFFMKASKMGLPATGLHIYQNETATFEVKMLNWVKVVDAKGEKMNQAETVTLLNDMCFIAPATLIDQRISWETLSNNTVRAIFKNENIAVSAILYFNDQGQLINFISNDRYDTDGKKYDNYPWATPVSDYRQINGYILPSKAKLIYQKADGDFTYGELEYKNVEYNVSNFKD